MKKLAIRIQSKPAESIIHHSFFKYKYIIHIPKLLTSFLVCKYKPENTVFFWECSHFYNLIIGRKILLNLNLLPLSKINHCLISQLFTKNKYITWWKIILTKSFKMCNNISIKRCFQWLPHSFDTSFELWKYKVKFKCNRKSFIAIYLHLLGNQNIIMEDVHQ